MKLLRAFKESTLQTKIFWIVSLGLGIITTFLCLYPYVWFPEHRSHTRVSLQKVQES